MKRPTLNGKEAAIKNKRTASDSPLNSVPANDNMGGRSPLETDGMTQMGEDADEYVTVLSNDLAASDGAYKFVSDNDSELGSASDKNTGDEDGDGGHHDSESDAAEEKAKSKGKGRRIFESSDFLSGSDEENEDIGDAMVSLVSYFRDRSCSYVFKGPRSAGRAVCAGERCSREAS